MRVTVLHCGEPIGVGELALAGRLAAGDLDALPAYRAVRPVVRGAECARRTLGAPPENPEGVDAADGVTCLEALARLDALAAVAAELELRDTRGARLATEWVTLWDHAGGFGLMAELTLTPQSGVRRPVPRDGAYAL